MTFRMVELIEAKRDGGALPAEALRWMVGGYTADEIPDYQMSAFLMAVFFRGMTDEELAAWTDAMLHSGDVLDLAAIPAPKIDKHSTGGVGDKVSIPLAPMVAACGVAIPMMSGRGLGHTGGTLDKLESIPGFRTAFDPPEFVELLRRNGLVLAGQSETLVPADRRLYALRDATGTVPSIPLIASSIMSKKLAEDLDGLVLDVKVGTGAFMKDVASARKLAETMVAIGKAHHTRVVGLLTNMDRPLGRAVGNAVEIDESLDVLEGGGPADLVEICYRLGSEMLHLAGVVPSPEEGRPMLEAAVAHGTAMGIFRRVIEAQGGDPSVIEDRTRLPQARHRTTVPAPRDGYVARADALDIGVAAVRLGAGRAKKEDTVDPAVGILVDKKPGDTVTQGEALATVLYNDEAKLAAAMEKLEGAWEIVDEPVTPDPLVLGDVR